MSIFKRLSTTIATQLDHVVGEIENHDAIVKASISDLKKKIVEAKVRLDHVRNETNQLQNQVSQHQTDAKRWQSRAIECAQTDEQKALSCVSRARQCEQQISQLESAVNQYQQSAKKLDQDIKTAENRARELKQKHDLMRARQSSCATLKVTQETDEDLTSMLCDTFDRWEIKLRQTELSIDAQPHIDSLEQEFVQQEQEDELRHALDDLLKSNQEAIK